MTTSIWWIRRDLRLVDNQALHKALSNSDTILPVFTLDHAILRSKFYSEQRFAFLLAGLRQLDSDLRERGSRLIVREGDPLTQLQQLCAETGAGAIFAEEDVTPYARRRDKRISDLLPLHLCTGLTGRHPTAVLKKDGAPYTVFTPFKKAWLAQPLPHRRDLLPAPSAIASPSDIDSLPLPTTPILSPTVPFMAGENEGHQRLEKFIAQRVAAYADQRNQLDVDGTSALSPYLRFGMVSARQALVAVLEALARTPDKQRKGADVWLSELVWREFYQMILYHFPHVRKECFRPKYNAIQWNNDPSEFAAWCEGKTGYPVVDAAMHQLKTTGWMHNRARMIVASFLTKDLLIDWRWGERWFMQHLIDGDIAANNGGWQWTAGTGTDAAPYFRIFNPILQGKKFDPDGAYVRRWLPQLQAVPTKFIHAPWEMPPPVQRRYGCVIGTDYPPPIIDHRFARQRTLAAYKAVG